MVSREPRSNDNLAEALANSAAVAAGNRERHSNDNLAVAVEAVEANSTVAAANNAVVAAAVMVRKNGNLC